MEIKFFGLARQYANLKEELLDATDNALKYGKLMNDQYTYEFEDWLKKTTNTFNAITVHSGTQALEIIAEYCKTNLRVNPSSPPKVILPNLTYPATLNAFLRVGWEVELSDTDQNGIMNNNEIRSGVHWCYVGFSGSPIPHLALNSPSVIVDGAQHWLNAGADLGIGMAISFDPTKNLNAPGNGGAIVTNNMNLANFARMFRNNGKILQHETIGTNSQMSELDCAHLLVKTKYLDQWQSRRKFIRNYYLDRFENLPIRCLSRGIANHMDQKFVIYSDKRSALSDYLRDKGIETRIHYPYALSELPISKGIKVKPDMMSVSVLLTRGVLSLPIYPELSNEEIEYIADQVNLFFQTTTGNK